MSPAYIPIIFLWIIIFIMFRKRKNVTIIRKLIRKKDFGGKNQMKELAKRFIGKECILYSFDEIQQYQGVIKEVPDSAILLEKGGKEEAINLDFIIRIREYPRKNNGNKKSVVLD